MTLVIIAIAFLIVGIIFAILEQYYYRKKELVKSEACESFKNLGLGFGIGLSILLIIGIIASYSTAPAHKNKMLAEREALIFSCEHLTDVYTDKIELNNSNLINDVKDFNMRLAYRQSNSHNIIDGWCISDWTDDISPINYEIILNNSEIFSVL